MSALGDFQARFLDEIFGDAPLDPRRAVYRRNVLENLHGALAAAYPVVRRLVGEAFFREAAERFARVHPSRSGDLHRFGEGYGQFLSRYPHAAGLPYLPGVARLEWAVCMALQAEEVVSCSIAALSRLGDDAGAARDAAYAAADVIEFAGKQLRRDIAQRAVERVA